MAMTSRVRLNLRQYEKVAASKSWTSQRKAAEAIGCEPSTLGRILVGESACSGEFIASLLKAAKPWEFDDLFVCEHEADAVPA
jgi:hypothetical protein